jgi:hypothetical protein
VRVHAVFLTVQIDPAHRGGTTVLFLPPHTAGRRSVSNYFFFSFFSPQLLATG